MCVYVCMCVCMCVCAYVCVCACTRASRRLENMVSGHYHLAEEGFCVAQSCLLKTMARNANAFLCYNITCCIPDLFYSQLKAHTPPYN
jgi:hypothetical protein